MKSFMKYVNDKKPNFKNTQNALQELLALLQALFLNHQNAHWQVSKDFYGNHLLLQRLYEKVAEEFDQLGEKITAYFGELNQNELQKTIQKYIEEWNKEKDVIKRSIKAEQYLQTYIQSIYQFLKNNQDMSLGLDDYLMSLANDHETHLYLLNQATKS